MQNRNKVVVAFLDGRRLKGFLYDFSPIRGYFFLFPENDGHPQPAAGLLVRLADLKALFFVKDFIGKAGHGRNELANIVEHQEHVEVVFADGEIGIGMAEPADMGGLGFFLTPTDHANNERIFVVNANVRQVRRRQDAAAQHA
jgi:uncharacterized protein DUF6982